MKKKLTEKLNTIKNLFEKAGVELDDNQVQAFATTFELQKKEAIAEEVKPLKEKLEEYQKRNYELQGALEESKQFSDKFEKLFEEKAKEIAAIKIPDIPNIEAAISKPLTEKLTQFEKKLAKLDEAVNKMNEKILPLKMDDDIKKINAVGNVFSNYKDVFAKHLVDIESAAVKKLTEALKVAEKKVVDAEKKAVHFEGQVKTEKENTEVTIMLENSVLDRQEKEHLFKYYEKLGFEEGKSEIQKFIEMKENKEREKPVSRSYVREGVGGVKPMNDTGMLQKRRLLGESTSFASEIEEWAISAGVDKAEKV
jgi:hypothetical protein